MVQARNHPDARRFPLPVLLLKFPASYLHSSRETRLMKHATCCPPPVRFRYESAPAGNLSPHTHPYGHRVGFVCMGVPPSLGVWANRAELGVPPIHTKPTRWPYGGICGLILPPGVDSYRNLTGGGQGVGCFISLRAQTAHNTKTFETEWYYCLVVGC